MLDAEFIPGTAEFEREENGVAWYSDRNGNNHTHYMMFDGRILSGGWVGPRWVFWTLTTMSQEERACHRTHDELMGEITRRLSYMRG